MFRSFGVIDCSFFINQMLIQLCFGQNELNFNFDEGVEMSVESSIGIAYANGIVRDYEDHLEAASELMNFLGKKVISAEADTAGTLTLKFEADAILRVYNSNEYYESYNVGYPKGLIVI